MPLNFQFLTRDYSMGWRAVIHDGEKVFVNQERIRTVRTYDNENWSEYWNKLRQMHLSYTWKERHAKGVPVEMTMDEMNRCQPLSEDTDDQHMYGCNSSSGMTWNPYVECSDPSRRGVPHIATFCNFRYKPEWLGKKKAVYLEEEQRKAWGGAWTAKNKDGSWVLPWHTDTHKNLFDSPPIGGIKD